MTSYSREGSVHAMAPRPPAKAEGRRPSSSVSEKISRMGLRECLAYEVQLRSLIDAAVAEPPPHGVGTAEVEHRMRLLQVALEEVTLRIEHLRQAKEERERMRFVRTQERRMQAEEEAEKARVFEDKHREELVGEMRMAQVAYYRDRNGRDEEKALRCRTHGERAQVETIQRASQNEGRRENNLKALMAERERQRRELHAKDVAQQESIREANRRKAARQELERREKERAARLHEQEMEAKLAAIRESKRSTWVAKKNASRAKSSVVFKNGRAILETKAEDHAKLVEDLESKIKGQQARYAEERADQLMYLQQRAQHRSMRQEKQQSNLLHLIESRLQRGEKIVDEAKQKKERAEQTREMQARQYEEHGTELRKDIAVHRQRANEIERRKEQEALSKNYRRWNHRAARIIAELNEAVAEDEAAAQQTASTTSAAGGGNGYYYANRTADTPSSTTASQRRVRLPSPSDFAVE